MSAIVVGGGAVGCTIAAHLTRSGVRVHLVDSWFEHVSRIRSEGLAVVTPEETFTAPVQTLFLDELEQLDAPVDFCVLAVKSYDTIWSMRAVMPYLSPTSTVVSSQNGINEDEIARLVGVERVVGCVPSFAAALVGPGQVRKTSSMAWPAFSIGELDGSTSARVEWVAGVLGAVGKVKISKNIWGELWSKLIVNSLSNASAGLTTFNTGVLWQNPVGIALGIQLGGEGVQVAAALKHSVEPIMGKIPADLLRRGSLGDRDAWEATAGLMRSLATDPARGSANVPSLLQDIQKHRRTEIDYLNGYIVRRAREVGVAVPLNVAMIALVKDVETGRLQSGPDNVEKMRVALEQAGKLPVPAGLA